MKFYVAVDVEGVACAVGKLGSGISDSPDFEFAKRQATRETNAAVSGLFKAGATEVIVWDNHGNSLNLDYEALDERCLIAVGKMFERRFPGLDSSFAGVAFIGYHARDNVVDSVLCHTYTSRDYQWIKINGKEVGEIAMDAAVAGEQKVPVFFVSSDHTGVAEAKKVIKNVSTYTTKTSMGWNAAISKHPKKAATEIHVEIQKAVRNLKKVRPFRFKIPLDMEIRFKRIDSVESFIRTGRKEWNRLDAYTVGRKMNSLPDYY